MDSRILGTPLPLGRGAAVLTFDVGGDVTKAALFDSDGQMLGLSHTVCPTFNHDEGDTRLDQIEDLTTQFARDFPQVTPAAVGLISAGLVDDCDGVAVLSSALRWVNVPYRKLARDRLRLPSSFSHDGRAAGDAEFLLGAARAYRNVVVIVIGPHISASIIIDGVSHTGGGFAGKLGHSIVDPFGERCICGARGCLETVASVGAIVRRYREATGQPVTGARDVLQRALHGDSAADVVWSDAVDAIALSISNLAAVLAPEAFVIGGGISLAGDEFFRPLRRRLDTLLSFHRRPVLLPAIVGENAGLVGAALHARAAVR